MRICRVRVALFAVDGFPAVTAVGGAIALATGLEGDRFPADWLSGTPFRSYVIPGLILAGLVGGSAALAAAATLRSPEAGGLASRLAGVIMVGWIAGEIVILTEDAELISPWEVFTSRSGWRWRGWGSRWDGPSAGIASRLGQATGRRRGEEADPSDPTCP